MPTRKPKEERDLFYAYMRQNGLKKTYQKDLILETFLNAEGHLSVEDVYSLVKKRDRRIGIVTVFRTLKSLTACGIAREITLGDGLTRFEHSYHHPHHHHIICIECHTTIEFISPELEATQLEIVKKYHFESSYHRFQIYGKCEDCREHRPAQTVLKSDTEKVFARDAIRLSLILENRGLDFYRQALARNQNAEGCQVLEMVIAEEQKHFGEIEAQLAEMQNQERGLEEAPILLHFDPVELESLVPDIRQLETNGELNIDAKQALKLSMDFERRGAEFFRDFAEKFIDTQGKSFLLHFAGEEMNHYHQMAQRMEDAAAVPSA